MLLFVWLIYILPDRFTQQAFSAIYGLTPKPCSLFTMQANAIKRGREQGGVAAVFPPVTATSAPVAQSKRISAYTLSIEHVMCILYLVKLYVVHTVLAHMTLCVCLKECRISCVERGAVVGWLIAVIWMVRK